MIVSILQLALLVLVGLLVLFYQVFVHYAAIMNLMRVRDAGQLSRASNALGMLALGIGYPLDFLFNLTWGGLLFLERPRELLFSGRVTRLVATDTGWRGKLALWVRTQLLDNIDYRGVHKG